MTKEFLKAVFSRPSVLGVVADVNQGKSNLCLYLMRFCLDAGGKVRYYALPHVEGAEPLYSLGELEACRDSIIFLDEFAGLFNIEDRRKRRLIEKTLRLIHHRNNILVLCGVCENYKKFISSKVSAWFFKKTTISDFINGSSVKRVVIEYAGDEAGAGVLAVPKDKALVFDGLRYFVLDVPYLEEFDRKKGNVSLLKNVLQKVQEKKCQKKHRKKSVENCS